MRDGSGHLLNHRALPYYVFLDLKCKVTEKRRESFHIHSTEGCNCGERIRAPRPLPHGAEVVHKFREVAEDRVERAWKLYDVHMIRAMIGVLAACYGDL